MVDLVGGNKPPKINLVVLIRKTLERVFVQAGLREDEATVRMVVTCIVNVAADYTRALGDDPKHIETLFHTFLTGTPDEQRAAVQAFGEAFLPKVEKSS